MVLNQIQNTIDQDLAEEQCGFRSSCGTTHAVFTVKLLKRQRKEEYQSTGTLLTLKEYYEIVGESRPLSAFFPKHADFFTEMHFYS